MPRVDRCECTASRRALKLMWALEDSPLWCLWCEGLVLLSSIRGLGRPLRSRLRAWRVQFEAIYQLWLQSSDYEEWARSQLFDMESPINRRGLDLTHSVTERLARPCVYWFGDDPEDPSESGRCPRCGTPGERVSWAKRHLVCQSCNIALSVQ